MMLVVIVFVFFIIAMLGMAVGVIAGRRPIAGSCGRDCSCTGSVTDSSGSKR
jgi:hypothetical protein